MVTHLYHLNMTNSSKCDRLFKNFNLKIDAYSATILSNTTKIIKMLQVISKRLKPFKNRSLTPAFKRRWLLCLMKAEGKVHYCTG